MAGHSAIGASSAYRWLNCPGSVRLSRGIESRPSEYASRGTAAHELCERCLLTGDDPARYLGEGIEADGREFSVDSEMVAGVSLYVETIRADRAERGGTLVVEQSFDLSWLHPGMFGRNDASLIPDVVCGLLTVYDYKNGRKPVRAKENPQGMYYALGALGPGNPYMAEEVEIVIVQPNCYGKDAVERWRISADALYRWGRGELLAAAKATEEADAPVVPGDWCVFCPAAARCTAKANEARALLAAPIDGELSLPPIGQLPPEQLGKMAAFFTSEAFESWRKALAAEEIALLQRGVLIPGRKLVELVSRGNRRWRDEAQTAKSLSGLLGKELYETRLLSPPQVEKLLTTLGHKPAERKRLLDDLVERPESIKLTAVSEDDPRASIANEKETARKLFKEN